MDYDDYFNSYMSSVSSSRAIIRSVLSLLERQDDMLRMMYLNWSAPQQEAASPAQQRRRTGWGTYSPVYRTAMRNTMQSPVNTRFHREYMQNLNIQRNNPTTPLNRQVNQDNEDNTIANIFAQAILNSIGNVGQMSPVVVRPSRRTIELATENILFSDIPSNIDRYQQCPISHDNFQASTPITRIRQCGHYFEREAIATWFQSSCRCPICRADIRDGIVDNSDHNEEVIDESDNSVGSADGAAADNNSNTRSNGNNDNTMHRDRSITDILSMMANVGDMEDAAGATISYQLEFVPVLQNVPSPQSANDRQVHQNIASMMNGFRSSRNNSVMGSHRTTFSRTDPSGNNISR